MNLGILISAALLIAFIVWFFFGPDIKRRLTRKGQTGSPSHSDAKGPGDVARRNESVSKVDLSITVMTSAACVNRGEKALKRVPGVDDAAVNLLANQATVAFDPAQAQPTTLTSAVEKIGYGASVITPDLDVKAEAAERSKSLTAKLVTAIVLT